MIGKRIERQAEIFSEPELLIDQLSTESFSAAFGKQVVALEALPPFEPADVSEMVWDILVATKFSPAAVRLAMRREILQPQQRTVRGKVFVDPQKLMEALQANQTLNFMGAERFRLDIRSITNALEERFQVPCSANLYISYKGSTGGYGPHRDQHDVIIVQLHGTKIWKIHPPLTDACPIRKTDVSRRELQGPSVEMRMTAGSCLYVPAGFAHDVVSSEGCSVHVTFGIECVRWWDILTDILAQIDDDVLFERLPVGEEAIIAAFESQIVSRLERSFSSEAISRTIEQYGYFASLQKQKSRVIRSLLRARTSVDR